MDYRVTGDRAMIASKVDDAAIEHVQRLEQPTRLQVRITAGSRLKTIEHLTPLTRTEKLRLRFAHALKVKTAAYGLSAVVAVAAGLAVQSVEREVTGYDPLKREQLLQRKAEKIASRNAWVQTGDRRQQDIGAWFNAHYRLVTQAITNPQELIENSDTYESLLEKYYNTLKVIDDASFLVTALLLFLMLGGYIDRRVNRSQDDVVSAEERERLRSKINEVIDAANRLNARGDRYGHNS
jgi:hypothetical protein